MDQTVVERLSFIKYVYSRGSEQATQPDPEAGIGLLTLHDAIELFLQLSVEYLDVSAKDVSFAGYWPLLKDRVAPDGLTHGQAMRRLNRARVNLKHHGIMPSSRDLAGYVASAESFFVENTPAVFGIEFSDITLGSLIHDEYARTKVQTAEALLQADDLEKAIGQLALAYQVLISSAETGRFASAVDRTFSIDLPPRGPPSIEEYELAEYLHRLHKSLEAMRGVLRLSAMGIDLPRLLRFKRLSPHVFVSMDHSNERVVWTGNTTMTKDEARFSLNFVIRTALHLQRLNDVP